MITGAALAALLIDIDTRLPRDLWNTVHEIFPGDDDEAVGDREYLATLLRAAYGKGYSDALAEPKPGQLCRDHGYRLPARRHT